MTLHLPVEVADYVDFYASLDHASNVGRIFRPDQEPLLPNWRHLPVGYHGRAGTVVPSGTPVIRPIGQQRDAAFGPSARLDIEAELGFVVGTPSTQGSRVSYDAFADHVFGVVGLNDWSARDIQAWEYVPLGPFLGKSFATSISQWVHAPRGPRRAWVDLPGQEPEPCLPGYLATRSASTSTSRWCSTARSSAARRTARCTGPAQMLAHLTVNGAPLCAPAISTAPAAVGGPEPGQRGSFLGSAGGEQSAFLDGDEVVLRYAAPGPGAGGIALGEVAGVVRTRPGLAFRPWDS